MAKPNLFGSPFISHVQPLPLPTFLSLSLSHPPIRSLTGSVSHIPHRLGHSLGIQPCRANARSTPAEDMVQRGPLITLHNGWTMPLRWRTELAALPRVTGGISPPLGFQPTD